MKFALSETEQDIMELLWKRGQWMSAVEFWDYFNRHGKTCKRQTIHTYLVRMNEKGLLVKNEKKYMYSYTRAEFEQKKAKEVLDVLFNGSLNKFMVSLTGNEKISLEEANGLKEFLKKLD